MINAVMIPVTVTVPPEENSTASLRRRIKSAR
jgi:hypothetical protein